jgi:hypothetical protein
MAKVFRSRTAFVAQEGRPLLHAVDPAQTGTQRGDRPAKFLTNAVPATGPEQRAELSVHLGVGQPSRQTKREVRPIESTKLANVSLRTRGGRSERTDESSSEHHPMDLYVVLGTRPQSLSADLREPVQDDGAEVSHRSTFDLAFTVLHYQLFAADTDPRAGCDNGKGLSRRMNRQEANRPECGISGKA